MEEMEEEDMQVWNSRTEGSGSASQQQDKSFGPVNLGDSLKRNETDIELDRDDENPKDQRPRQLPIFLSFALKK